jgi:hypothetical protein
VDGLQGRAAAKQQKYAPAAYVVGAESRVPREQRQAEDRLIEKGGPVEVIDIEASFENAVELGNGWTSTRVSCCRRSANCRRASA